MTDRMRDAYAVEELIASLESAAESSRDLDGRIALSLGMRLSDFPGMTDVLAEEDLPGEILCELLEGDVPRYTESLDAGIPGENIVLAMNSSKRGKWAAVHRSDSGDAFLAWGTTEILARRAAALKGWRTASDTTAGEDREEPAPDQRAPDMAPTALAELAERRKERATSRSQGRVQEPAPPQGAAGRKHDEDEDSWAILF